eukprot:jgi/Ulvmu1/12805/UM097_0034.1
MALATAQDQDMQQYDDSKKQRIADRCVEQLKAQGLTNAIVITDKFDGAGRAVFKADAKNGERVAVRAYRLQGGFDCNKAALEVIRLSSLHHPHIVQPKSLIRTADFLCVVVEYANGGDLYRMVRRGGAKGLPAPAARFLFQQLVLALDFCHRHGIFLRDINPSNLLIFWNEKGMPILKISDFRLAKNVWVEGQAETPVVATMYTCPQMIRQAGLPCGEEWRDLAPVCDVWSAVVTLYFLLQGSWPFTKQQIIAWGTTHEEWADDKKALEALSPNVPKEVRALFESVFAGGGLSPDRYKVKCPSVHSIIEMAWFREDLPKDADKMTEIYTTKTEERKKSPALKKLRALVEPVARTIAPDVTKPPVDCNAITPAHQRAPTADAPVMQ